VDHRARNVCRTKRHAPVFDRAYACVFRSNLCVGHREARAARPALIGLMVYSFARIGTALGMTIEDVYTQNRRLWVRLQRAETRLQAP
jgi:hypothetical protein